MKMTLGILGKTTRRAGKAIEHYQKFLDLWKDADPGIAEVANAKKRMTRLRGL